MQNKNELKINNKITINKISDSKIEVVNSNKNDVKIVLPFVDYRFKKDNKNFFYKKFKIKNIKRNNKVIVNYSSGYFMIIKAITIFSLLFLIYVAYFRKQKFVKIN